MGQFPRRRIRVSDASGFCDAFNGLVTAVASSTQEGSRGPSGQLRRAARALKPLGRGTVHRWQRGGVKQINSEQWDELLAAISRNLPEREAQYWRHRIEACVFTPNEQVVLSRYQAWCRKRFESLYVDGVGRWLERYGYLEQFEVGDYANLSRRAESELALDHAIAACPDLFTEFQKWLDRHGVSTVRRAVAVLRILEPLLQCADSALVERHWSRLSDREWKKFVKASIDREKIALDRDDDRAAARRAADGGPSVWDWYDDNPLPYLNGPAKRSTLAIFGAAADDRVAGRVSERQRRRRKGWNSLLE
jgi:hypothetical protein